MMSEVFSKTHRFLKRYWLHLLIALVLILIYRGWLRPGPLTYGDWGYHSQSMLRHFLNVPFAWEPAIALGQPNLSSLYWFIPQHVLWGLLTALHLPYSLSERIIWFFPCVLIAAFSAYYFGKTVFRNRMAACVTTAVFILNGYFLRISTGGSVNLGTSIALAPLVLALLIRARQERGIRYPVLAGLALWLQGTYDLRFCYLTILIAVAGWLFLSLGSARYGRQGLKEATRWGGYLALSLSIWIGANIYWLLPNLFGPGAGLPGSYGESWWVPYLSFGKLVHGLTMYDPGWPARTFGQLTELGPSSVSPFFVLIPIIGFGAVFFALRGIKYDRARARIALAGCALTLTGVFLVKGSNKPFGGIYVWLFNHLPGFGMFRDSNKMFLLVILGYTILMGLATLLITDWLSSKSRSKALRYIVAGDAPSFAILLILCLLALPALSGSMGGVFSATRPARVPDGYRQLDRLLENDKKYYRTFWFPDTPRFTTKGPDHPAVSAAELFSGKSTSLQPFHGQLAQLASTESPMSAMQSPILPGLLDSIAVRTTVVPEELNIAEDFIYSKYASKGLATSKKEFETLAASIPGTSGAISLGGNEVYARSGGKDHVFVPSRCVSVLGSWATVITADGAPGLDLNKCVYFLSEQGKATTKAFSMGFPTDAFISGEPTALDALMPFVREEHLFPVAGAMKGASSEGWESFPTGRFNEMSVPVLRSMNNDDRSLDYGVGAVLCTSGYEPPPAGWEKSSKLINTIDMNSLPTPFNSDYPGLKLKTDSSRLARGAPSLRGSLGAARHLTKRRIAYSVDEPCSAGHLYGVRFMVSGERLNEARCKVDFFNSNGKLMGEQVLVEDLNGTFGFKEFSSQFVTTPDAASFRLEVSTRGNEKHSSAWNLSDVEIYDLMGLSRRTRATVPVVVGSKGTYHFVVRCLGLNKSGRMGFSVDGGKQLYLNTYTPMERLGWFDLGKLELAAGEHTVEMTNFAGANLVNALALVTEKELAAAEERLSAAISDKDVACAIDVSHSPKEISYSSGYLTRSDTIYCPADSTLAPTFTGDLNLAGRGARVRLNGTEFELSKSMRPTNVPGWVSVPEVRLQRGEASVQISYPVESLVKLPAYRGSIGAGRDWNSVSDGLVLNAESSSRGGTPYLTGQVMPGDPKVQRVARSRMFEVKPRTDYYSFLKLEGRESKGLKALLVMLDGEGKEISRCELTDKMDGTLEKKDAFREVTTHPAARYGVLEVICYANAQGPSSWRLSDLFLNKKSSAASPVKRLALVPGGWISPGVTGSGKAQARGKAELAAEAQVLESSPTGYRVRVSNAKRPFLLVFSEQYTADWQLCMEGKKITPLPVETLVNGYPLCREGTYEITLKYRPQRWVNLGLIPSILTILACCGFLLVKRYRRRMRIRARPGGGNIY